MLLEHWSFVDAVLMTLVSVTTVGYDVGRPLNEAGRVFTMTVIVSGVGTMLYTLGIFGELLVDGQLPRYARMRRMERRVADLRDHFVVCGYGRMGTRVAEEFTQINPPFLVVESNTEPLALPDGRSAPGSSVPARTSWRFASAAVSSGSTRPTTRSWNVMTCWWPR
jgi:voltage-gated potassium channel